VATSWERGTTYGAEVISDSMWLLLHHSYDIYSFGHDKSSAATGCKRSLAGAKDPSDIYCRAKLTHLLYISYQT